MRKVVLFLATWWVLIYSNARMADVLPTYKVVHLFPIPQPVRILELLIIVFLYVLALATKMTKRILILNLCILCYLIIAIAALVLGGNVSLDAIQDVYIRVAPFLFFVVVLQGSQVMRSELNFFTKFFTIAISLSAVIALLYQIPFYGYYEDNINGFFEDAHMFGDFLAVFSIVFFYDYIKTKKYSSLFWSFGFLLISTFPKNEKVIAINIFIIGVLFVYDLIRRARGALTKMSVVTALFILFFSGVAYIMSIKDTNENLRRANIAINTIGVENIGPTLAWPIAFNEIKKSGFDFFFGVGAGQYGWIAASRSVAAGNASVHSKLFEFEFNLDNENNSGFLFRTNTWSSLLAEYGIIGFVLFLVSLVLIVKGVKSYKTTDRLERNLKAAFYSLLALVVLQGFFTPYSNWSSSALTFPMMYLAAHFHQSSYYPQKENNKEDDLHIDSLLKT
ncbi:MAG: hypothetical protein ACTHMV_08735 [Chitinophagaceae bacterium]